MDDDSKSQTFMKVGLGALGLGAIGAGVLIPGKVGILIAVAVLLLGLLLFGAYYFWFRRRARRNREQFTSAIESQAASAPRSISDPKKRADLDKVREKFQTGLQEFKSRGKDIYKLPWYVIIGESGSGKTEAIRHSEIDFPPGLNKEHQGSGGTVNMDWWFTNRGVILDTAGSMLFPEAGAADNSQWQEFLRLLKKARPDCPINGLFLVLSIESLIKDSADRISQKASRLAQQLDLIQRALDVRFPVYLLITKSDLLTGFREFFDSIEDPLLQHQIFGWSNPDPLDAPFRPDLVDQHLGSMAARVRRRRLALLRESSAAGRIGDTQHFFASSYQLGKGVAQQRRLDEVDSMFAFPESIMRLAPRLRRYLETIFVAGEWSAKPVFLRGIYFTSSMREGRALDEAMALAANISLDQLPQDRAWERNRAFFLRDLFHEKVFRESGLVTRATNTLKLLRKRQLAIFGSAGGALLILLIFAGFAYHNLKQSVLSESAYWQIGATNLTAGVWSTPIVQGDSFHLTYAGANLVPGADKLNLIQYHQKLREVIQKPLSVSWIFWPMKLFNIRDVKDRPQAQRVLFEASVLDPLTIQTRKKLINSSPTNGPGLDRHKAALLSLIEVEGDARGFRPRVVDDPTTASRYLTNLVSYLTDDEGKVSPELADLLNWTFSTNALQRSSGVWPPKTLSGGGELEKNVALNAGIQTFHKVSITAQTNILNDLKLADDAGDKLYAFYNSELRWLTNGGELCSALQQTVAGPEQDAENAWKTLERSTNTQSAAVSSLMARYRSLGNSASNSSASALKAPVTKIVMRLPERQPDHLFEQIQAKLNTLAGNAAEPVTTSLANRAQTLTALDNYCLTVPTNAAPGNSRPAFLSRWQLYSAACALKNADVKPQPADIGSRWARFGKLKDSADRFRTNLASYNGPLAGSVSNACERIAAEAEGQLKNNFVSSYVAMTSDLLSSEGRRTRWDPAQVTGTRILFTNVAWDIDGCDVLAGQKDKVESLRPIFDNARESALRNIKGDLANKIGFPVSLKSTQPMRPEDVGALRQLLGGLKNELGLPIWQSKNQAPLEALRKSCDDYFPVINMLVADTGDPTEWELCFVEPEVGSDDYNVISALLILEARIDKESKQEPNLTRYRPREVVPLIKGGLQQGITLAFQKRVDSPRVEIKKGDWWLPSLMRDNSLPAAAQPVGGWRFKVPLEDPDQKDVKGFVTFEARPVNNKAALAKLEDWAR
jgi:ImcF (intracellular multiplication and macrophage-killing)-related protein